MAVVFVVFFGKSSREHKNVVLLHNHRNTIWPSRSGCERGKKNGRRQLASVGISVLVMIRFVSPGHITVSYSYLWESVLEERGFLLPPIPPDIFDSTQSRGRLAGWLVYGTTVFSTCFHGPNPRRTSRDSTNRLGADVYKGPHSL